MAFGQQQSKPDSLMQSMGVAQKPSQPKPPSSLRDKLSASPSPSSSPSLSASSPSSSGQPGGGLPGADGQQQPGQGGLASRDDAGFIPAGQICGGCTNYTKETGTCTAVEGPMQPHDSCKTYYQAANAQGQQQEEGLESTPGPGGGDQLSALSVMNG